MTSSRVQIGAPHVCLLACLAVLARVLLLCSHKTSRPRKFTWWNFPPPVPPCVAKPHGESVEQSDRGGGGTVRHSARRKHSVIYGG